MRQALTLLLLCLPFGALAAPQTYVLEPDGSTVAFETDFGPDHITGSFPVSRADLSLDFAKVADSRVAVTLDVGQANASFPFAAQALKGPKVLDAAAFPQMTFNSTSVKATKDGADIAGDLTIRGVRRPVVLAATIFRQKGTEAGDLSHLTLHLKGLVHRSEFGATGWADMVGDEVRIDIRARIARK